MHNCPECEGACWCDGEDHFQPAPEECIHECPVDDEDDDEFAQYDYED